jgi:hypothetical protein
MSKVAASPKWTVPLEEVLTQLHLVLFILSWRGGRSLLRFG